MVSIELRNFHIPLEDAYTVNLSDSLGDAVGVMDRHNIDQVPVVDASYDGAMVVTRRTIATVPPTDRRTTLVQDVLAEHINDPKQRVQATTRLPDAQELLIEYDWVLTTDQDGKPIGLATVGDALRAAIKSISSEVPI